MIKLTDNLEINKPAPADDRLGVFASVAEANQYIHIDRRFLGLKVLIDNAGTAEEYWYQDGITDGDLVAYSAGGGGGATWGSITGTLSNQTDLQTELDSINGNVTTIQGDITTIQGQISTINSTAVFDGDTAGGDLSGTYPSPSVHRVHGIDFQSGNPSAGDVWIFGGSPAKWQHQGLTNSEIPSGIDASKIANGNVSNTEFQYLDGVTSAIQNQIDGKVTSNGAITGSTRTKITYDSKGLVTAGADLSASDVPSLDASKITSGTFASARIPQVSRPVIRIVTPSTAGNSTTNEINITSITIPANSLIAGDIIRIGAFYSFGSAGGTKTPRIRLGLNSTAGNPLYSPSAIGASVTNNQVEVLAIVTSSTNLRIVPSSTTSGLGTGTGALTNNTIDLSQPISFSFNIQKAVAADTAILEFAWIEILTS